MAPYGFRLVNACHSSPVEDIREQENKIWSSHPTEVKQDVWDRGEECKGPIMAHFLWKVSQLLKQTQVLFDAKKKFVWASLILYTWGFTHSQRWELFFLSLQLRWWGRSRNSEREGERERNSLWWLMLKKETGAYAHKAPSYYSLDTQSIRPWHPVLCTGPPMNAGLLTWYHFVLRSLCNSLP